MDFISNIVIITGLCVLFAALGIALYSVWHSLKVNKRKTTENGVPVGLIGWGTVGLVVIVFLPTLLIAGITSACLITSLIMLCVATGALIYSKCSSAKRAIPFRG